MVTAETPVGATGAAKQLSGSSGTPPERPPKRHSCCWGPGRELTGVREQDALEIILVKHAQKKILINVTQGQNSTAHSKMKILRIYLEPEAASLLGLHAAPPQLVQLELDAAMMAAAAAAAEAVGSTTGWAGASSFSSDPPGKSESDRWISPRLVVASCGWETRSCEGVAG